MRWSKCPVPVDDSDGDWSSGDFSLPSLMTLSWRALGQHFPEPTFDEAFSVLRHRIVE